MNRYRQLASSGLPEIMRLDWFHSISSVREEWWVRRSVYRLRAYKDGEDWESEIVDTETGHRLVYLGETENKDVAQDRAEDYYRKNLL